MKILLPILLLLISGNALAINKVSQSTTSPKLETVEVKQKSHSESDVWLHQLTSTLYQDLDQDGYFQSFKLDFDLDTQFTEQDVFVEVWLNSPSAEHQLLYISDTIHLSSDSTADSQQINIQLLEQYAQDYYSLEFIVFDSSSALKIFSLDQYDNPHLQNLALEGQSSDQYHEISIYSANIELLGDDNHNGYYDRFSVVLDVDFPHSSAELVAQFYLDGKLLYTSNSFLITDTDTSDKQYFDLEIASGLIAGYYDLDIHLVDADDLAHRHTIAAADWIEFSHLPLESVYEDSYDDSDLEVYVDHHGGSIGLGLVGMLILVTFRILLSFRILRGFRLLQK